jgi:hypothetical protein
MQERVNVIAAFMKGRGYLIGMLAMAPAAVWPASTTAWVLRYAAMAYIVGSLLLQAHAGYRRRLPYWTRESWRRFLTFCAMSGAALAICIGMAAAVDARLPIVGAAYSTMRSIWVLVMMAFMIAGAGGLTSAVFWLSDGDESAQFTRFQRRRLHS